MTFQNTITKSIVLIGMMGAGKSSIGRRLATRLSLPFIDADTEIEIAAGCSIGDIFERHGEDEFRAGERRVIARLLARPPHVLATGGGAFMNEQTRDIMRDRGISIWLQADLEVLLQRVSRRNDRPMLQADNQRAKLVQLMEQRDPWYAHADLVVESTENPLEETAYRVFEILEQYLSANKIK